MRKLLLASAAVLGTGLGLAGYASAQELPIPAEQGKLVTQPATGGGANNNNNYQAPMLPGPVANPTPGSMVIHIYGRVEVDVAGNWSSQDSVGGFKVSPTSVMSYMRIYPGVDAMATNGLRYGASIELRENFTGATTPGGSASTGSSGYTSAETVFVRRAFVYAGMDQVGILRVGQADGVIGIFDNGVTTFQFLPTGNLNGGDLEAGGVGNTGIPFAFGTQAGNEYGSNKLVYLSPQFAGFDVGFSWAPTGYNGNGWGATCGVAGPTCVNLSASPAPLDGGRVTNFYEAGVRYQGKFGDASILAYAAYLGSGHATYNGPAIPLAASTNAAGTGRFENLSAGSFGAAVTFAGLTVGGNVIIGSVNGQLGLKPAGGVNQQGFLAGAKYAMGPLTVGVVGEIINDQGSPGLVGISQRHQSAIDVGASYTIAPGFTAFAEYMYQARHQGNFNFATSAISRTGAVANSDIQAQGALVGAVVTW